MSFKVEDFPELVTAINTHPEWRRQLVKVLFPNIDLAQSMRELKQALKELAQAQARTEQSLNLLTKKFEEAAEDRRQIHIELGEAAEDRRQIRVEFNAKFEEAAEDRQRMNTHLGVLHRDVATLKGLSYERTIRDVATGIFGIVIRRGKDDKGKISEQLYEAMTAGKISEAEFTQVMAIDLLWSGLLHVSGRTVVLAIEASWRAELNDIERAVTRANILRAIEINALPVVAGKLWDKPIIDLALERGVVIVDTKQVNKDTWDSALIESANQRISP